MAPDPADLVRRIQQEECGVLRLRTVHRIGQPEIVPDQDAVLIAGVVKAGMARHPHPVSDHRQIGFRMEPDLVPQGLGCIPFQAVVHAPVATLGQDPDAVAIEGQEAAVHRSVESPDAEAEAFSVAGLSICPQFCLRSIKERISIGVWPPQLRPVEPDSELHRNGLLRPQPDHRFKGDLSRQDPSPQFRADWLPAPVPDFCPEDQRRLRGIQKIVMPLSLFHLRRAFPIHKHLRKARIHRSSIELSAFQHGKPEIADRLRREYRTRLNPSSHPGQVQGHHGSAALKTICTGMSLKNCGSRVQTRSFFSKPRQHHFAAGIGIYWRPLSSVQRSLQCERSRMAGFNIGSRSAAFAAPAKRD